MSSRRTFALLFALTVLGLAVVLSLLVGARPLPLTAILEALGGRGDPSVTAVVMDSRLPRTLLGLLAGAALGVAGALIQGVTRNPLADPGLLGVNAGAAFAVVLAVGIAGIAAPLALTAFACLGAGIATVGVHLVGGRRGLDPVRLTLAGVAVGAVLTGITQALALGAPHAFDRLRLWNIGTLDVRSFEPLAAAAPVVGIGLLAAALATHSLNALALGDDLAAGLGARVVPTRVLAVTAVTLLAGGATAAAGAIGFLGLAVPHLARRLTGPDQPWIAVLSVLLAPAVLLLADVLGRVIAPGEVQAGVMTAFVGAPVLIAIARRRRLVDL